MQSILIRVLVAAALTIPLSTLAQSYPAKPIRLVVAFSAGGGLDVPARMLAKRLTENMGQSVIVENAPGASSFIAMQKVATSPPSGYTLLMFSSNDTSLPALRPDLPINLERDFAPVTLLAVGAMVLVVRPTMPANNVKELIALAQSQPGKLSFGSSGVGSTVHLTNELFNAMADVKIVHVPFKGSADSVVAIAGGQIDMSFPSLPAAMPLVNVGKLRALAVTSAKRLSALPSIPTVDESGVRGFDRTWWFGVTTPAGVHKDIIARLNAELAKVANTPEINESFNKLGLEVKTSTPEQFGAFIHSEIAQSAKLVAAAGFKAQ